MLLCTVINYLGGSSHVIEALLMVLLFFPLSGLEKFEPALYGKNKFRSARLVSLFLSILIVVFAGGAAYLFNDWKYAVVGLFMARLCTLAVGWTVVWKLECIRKDKSTTETEIKQFIKEGWKLSGVSFFNAVVSQVDRLTLGVIDPKILAIYSIGILIPMRVKDQLKAVVTVPVQSWARGSKEDYIRQVSNNLRKLVFVTVAIAIFTGGICVLLIPIVFGNDYKEAVWISVAIAWTIPLANIANVFEQYNITYQDTEFYQKTVYFKQVLYLALIALLFPVLAVAGLVIAILLRDTFNLCLQWGYFIRQRRAELYG